MLNLDDLKKDQIYLIKYWDHFEQPDDEEMTVSEVGYYIGENSRYVFFASYKDSDGNYYNRTGIIKSQIKHIRLLEGVWTDKLVGNGE